MKNSISKVGKKKALEGWMYSCELYDYIHEGEIVLPAKKKSSCYECQICHKSHEPFKYRITIEQLSKEE